MEIKDFKAGIAQLSSFTNQRAKEPEPFILQIGKDDGGSVKLIAADERATIAWHIGWTDAASGRWGVPSKMLYQAAKVLKGKGVVDFSYLENDMKVHVDGGGQISLPYGEMPTIYHKPDKSYDLFLDQIDLGEMAKRLSAVEPTRENYVVATPIDPNQTVTVRLNASNGYVIWETRTMPPNEIVKPIAWRLDAMTALKAVPKDSVLSLGEKTIRIDLGDYTLYSRLLEDSEFIHYPSLKAHHYPEGKKPRVGFEVDRKQLAGAIKAVAPDARKDKDQQFFMAVTPDTVVLSGIQHQGSVTVPFKKSYGTGSIALGAIHTLPILNSMDASSILVVFSDPKTPVGFKAIANPYESFLCAPVFNA